MENCVASPDIVRASTIGGWMSEGELIWLATQASQRKLIVEFGSLHGRSTRAMADNNKGVIWAVDPWKGDYFQEDGTQLKMTTYVMPYFLENLKDHIATQHVIPVRQFSYLFSLDWPVDMVFIDGDHRLDTVVRDIKKAYELLRPGGLICGHDYNHPMWPGVKQAVDELVIGPIQITETIWSAIVPKS
jgi:predicted O-methyltransferase YrrM